MLGDNQLHLHHTFAAQLKARKRSLHHIRLITLVISLFIKPSSSSNYQSLPSLDSAFTVTRSPQILSYLCQRAFPPPLGLPPTSTWGSRSSYLPSPFHALTHSPLGHLYS
ncbi:hypothetical protein ERO13_D06G092766v2 [Gossypium hirsutum]|nr:hypothetical protein ERO13_D06G092766v2 [Gossypium hirsutum]